MAASRNKQVLGLQEFRWTAFVGAAVLVFILSAGDVRSASAAAPPDLLSRARLFYNQQQYDQAIELARQAQANPRVADAAALVLARASLERYRKSSKAEDLIVARRALASLKAVALSPRDRGEFVIGLAEALYLEGLYSASADMFDTAFTLIGTAPSPSRDQLLDWWASAVERTAEGEHDEDRADTYERIVTRMQDELSRDPASPTATYWAAAATRGAGDPDRAWALAVAGWVRAPLAADRASSLRGDLDRLMIEGIIPDRARERATTDRDRERETSEMRAHWEQIKELWAGK